MKNVLRIGIAVLTPLMLLAGLHQHDSSTSVLYISGQGGGVFDSGRTPEATIEALLENIKLHRYHAAYQAVANIDQVDEKDFTLDTRGALGDLRSFSALEDYQYRVLRKSDREALVRATFNWSTAVGMETDTRDLTMVNRSGEWKVVWPEFKLPHVAPQVLPVNYSAWNVIWRGERDHSNAEPPKVRVVGAKALGHGNGTVIVGEIVNDDSVPAAVSIEGSLVGGDGAVLATESPFDKMVHVLVPKQSSPFRLDFPGIRIVDVKNVRLQAESALTSASTDPAISVADQHLDVDARGRHVLTGELMNEGGQLVNIPHVVAACYDSKGQVVWVSAGYVDRPLLPQSKVPFALDVPDDVAGQVQSARVTVNQYTTNLY